MIGNVPTTTYYYAEVAEVAIVERGIERDKREDRGICPHI
jgi:hypothetical protein